MTCKQVLAFIDALPFAECSPSQLAAVERHVRDCASCQRVSVAAKALDSELSRLPEPAPPAGMAAAILSRTAHHDEQRAVVRDAVVRDAARVAPARTRSDWHVWAVLLAGVTIGLGAQAYRLLTGESTLHFTPSFLRGGTEGLLEMPHASPAVFFLAAGLLFYVVGLFAPPRGTDTSANPPYFR